MNSKKYKYMSSDELLRFMDAVRQSGNLRDRVLFSFIYKYGLRLREALEMKFSDIHPKFVKLTVKRLKGGIDRDYSISPKDARLLKRYLKERMTYKNSDVNPFLFTSPKSLHGPMSSWAVQKRMKQYCEVAGIPKDKCHPHALRHSIAIHFLQEGRDIHFVRDYLGHTNLKTTQIYSELSPPDWFKRQQDAVENLPDF